VKNPVAGTFRSLRSFNFRLWTAGALVSNVGTWTQRVAQDWLVLTQLTHHDASALGIVVGLQFAPQLLLLPWTGSAADRLNQRKLLMPPSNSPRHGAGSLRRSGANGLASLAATPFRARHHSRAVMASRAVARFAGASPRPLRPRRTAA
jgi:hypothetical protein